MLQFLHKNKRKTIIFNVKKSLQTNFFFFVRTYNLNWETLTTKNLVILLKDGMGLRMKNFDIMADSLKNLNIYGGFTKKQYIYIYIVLININHVIRVLNTIVELYKCIEHSNDMVYIYQYYLMLLIFC